MKPSPHDRRHQQRIHRRQGRQRRRRQEYERERNRQKQQRQTLVFRLQKTITQYFPDLYHRMQRIPECRQKSEYDLIEILMAGLALFLFKKGSRNALNNEREDPDFRRNYARLFKVRLPHLDTVTDVLDILKPEHLEQLKTELVQGLFDRKVFRKFRLHGKYYRVAVDATHVMTVHEGHCEHCLHKTLKNGDIMYFHVVLEAKLVCPNGFCISLATEWLENPEEYIKQDCELKAFPRLAEKLHQAFPRLPICLVADSLYPNAPFFQRCEAYGWQWIVTFKKGTIPTVWADVLQRQDTTHHTTRCREFTADGQPVQQTYTWETGLTYRTFTVQWFSCREIAHGKLTTFTYLSSLAVDYQLVVELTASGRVRWKIENEGFNIQKHHGYGLGHQFSRNSMTAMKNYYQLMQIGHMINQLLELSTWFRALCTRHITVMYLWDCLVKRLSEAHLDVSGGIARLTGRLQCRYD